MIFRMFLMHKSLGGRVGENPGNEVELKYEGN